MDEKNKTKRKKYSLNKLKNSNVPVWLIIMIFFLDNLSKKAVYLTFR